MADTPEQARRAAELWCQKLRQDGGMTVREAVRDYLAHLREAGAKPNTLRGREKDLRLFFGSNLGEALSRQTSLVCAQLYACVRNDPNATTGEKRSVDTQQTFWKAARRFFDFCVESQWLRTNPMAEIKAVGRRRKGKPQLRVDEARRFFAHCLDAAREGDDSAVAALVGLLMALRPGEIDSRTVRDLDDGGRILWVDDNEGFERKTEKSRRAVQVPQVLRPLLQALVRDKVGAALLWPARSGHRHGRGWVNLSVHRLCRDAGVPEVCAHSLRGLQATTALHAGATPEMVAAVLGHQSPGTTLAHYAAPGSRQASDAAARVLLFKEPQK